MAEPKTQPNAASVKAFLNSVKDERKRADSFELLKLMEEVTGEKAEMWGSAIVGFGTHPIIYANGREEDWPMAGFSPRAQGLTVYFEEGFAEKYDDLLAKLGKHSTSKVCLYIKRLEQVDMKVLKQLLKKSIADLKRKGPSLSH
ncbi:MAG: DUF1801 domain-containing protein [Anaerolineae bacterium]|nr:MAG: DUF1801 domain-containing protein [Anaerolineae bacterium]